MGIDRLPILNNLPVDQFVHTSAVRFDSQHSNRFFSVLYQHISPPPY
jgi:hypothetical protein